MKVPTFYSVVPKVSMWRNLGQWNFLFTLKNKKKKNNTDFKSNSWEAVTLHLLLYYDFFKIYFFDFCINTFPL